MMGAYHSGKSSLRLMRLRKISERRGRNVYSRVPAKVIQIEEQQALVDVMGSRMYVGTLFVPEVKIDDYVLLHAGQAMTIVE